MFGVWLDVGRRYLLIRVACVVSIDFEWSRYSPRARRAEWELGFYVPRRAKYGRRRFAIGPGVIPF